MTNPALPRKEPQFLTREVDGRQWRVGVRRGARCRVEELGLDDRGPVVGDADAHAPDRRIGRREVVELGARRASDLEVEEGAVPARDADDADGRWAGLQARGWRPRILRRNSTSC